MQHLALVCSQITKTIYACNLYFSSFSLSSLYILYMNVIEFFIYYILCLHHYEY